MAFMKNLADKINKKLHSDDEVIEFKKYDDATDEKFAAHTEPQGSTLTADGGANDNGGIVFKVVKPQSFEEVGTIADYLLDGCTVILNTELIDKPVCLRMLDFLNGVTYTTDGDIKSVAVNTYIITPHNVDVSEEG